MTRGFSARLQELAPRSYKQFIRAELRYADIDPSVAGRFLGFALAFTVAVFPVTLIVSTLVGVEFFISFLVSLFVSSLVFVGLNLSIVFIADARAHQIEEILPDSLQLIAANVRSGITVDKAIWLSARPEFGVLEEELRKAGAQTVSGTPLAEALFDMSTRIKSKMFERTVRLINEGIESGGELAHLLENIAANIRTTQALRKEISASVMMYALFITFATVIGAPLLYAISLYFVDIMGQLWSPETISDVQGVGGGIISPTGIQITTDELFLFSLASLTVTTFFGSLIIGLIRTGQERNGVKYMPMLVLGSIAVFLVMRYLISSVFGTLFVTV